jgi:hypothetical protein
MKGSDHAGEPGQGGRRCEPRRIVVAPARLVPRGGADRFVADQRFSQRSGVPRDVQHVVPWLFTARYVRGDVVTVTEPFAVFD